MDLNHSNDTKKSNFFIDAFRKKETLETNLKPAREFISPSYLNWAKECVISPSHYYHVTTYKHIPSIITTGLDPAYGGKGGSSEKVGFEDFMNISKGNIHLSCYTSNVKKYINLYDKSSDFNKKHDFNPQKADFDFNTTYHAPTTLGESAVVLRVPKKIEGIEWDEDYDDKEGVTSSKAIEPEHIEALTTQGWIPVSDLVEIRKALGKRRTKRDTLNLVISNH